MPQSKYSLNSVSPVSCQSEEGTPNCSVDIPEWLSPGRAGNLDEILRQCKCVIDDLQSELSSERQKREFLAIQLSESRSQLDQSLLELEAARSRANAYIEDLTRTKLAKLEQEKLLQDALNVEKCKLKKTNEELIRKDMILSNMTKRIDNKSSNEGSTDIINQLKEQLIESTKTLKSRDEETREMMNSYENQIKMLRAEIYSNRDVMMGITTQGNTPLYTPSISPQPPRDSATHADWEKFLKNQFSKVQYK